MSTRQNILNALRVDFLTIKNSADGGTYNNTFVKNFKNVMELAQVNDLDMPAVYLRLLPAKGERREGFYEWTLPVMAIVYFTVDTDVSDEGLKETKAEELIEDVLSLFETYSTVRALDEVQSLTVDEIDTYIDEAKNKGILVFTINIIHT